jgi:hypothetical protein
MGGFRDNGPTQFRPSGSRSRTSGTNRYADTVPYERLETISDSFSSRDTAGSVIQCLLVHSIHDHSSRQTGGDSAAGRGNEIISITKFCRRDNKSDAKLRSGSTSRL